MNRIGNIILKTEYKNPTKNPDEKFLYIDVSSVSNTSFQIDKATKIKGKSAPSRARKLIKENDVLIATVRPTLKRIALVPNKYDNQICSTAFCVLRSDSQLVDPQFLYYSLLTKPFEDYLQSHERGANYPAVRDSDIKNYELNIPLLVDQKNISHILSTIQTAIEQQDKIIGATTELKKALMQKLFTEGLYGEKQKQTEIGLVPVSWKAIRFQDIMLIPCRNGIYKQSDFYGTGDNHLVQIGDLYTSDFSLNIKNLINIKLTNLELNKYQLKLNDILINRVSKKIEGVGYAALLTELPNNKCVYESNMFRIRIKSTIVDPRFFVYFTKSNGYINQVRSVANKGNQTSINQGNLQNFHLPLPTLKEQQEIINILETIDNKSNHSIQEVGNLKILFNSMLHQLMSGEIRVDQL